LISELVAELFGMEQTEDQIDLVMNEEM